MIAWRDQVALVTGGARGIGRATARLLAQRGAAVCVNYAAHVDAADRLAAEIVADGGRAISVMADIAETAAIDAVVAPIEKELGPLTILVNNARALRKALRRRQESGWITAQMLTVDGGRMDYIGHA
jgi:3-oxoacyl-[acyl-carrier protein] reductase